MVLWRGNATGTPSWFRDFVMLFFSCDFFSGALYRPPVLETAEARELPYMDSCPQYCSECGFPSVAPTIRKGYMCLWVHWHGNWKPPSVVKTQPVTVVYPPFGKWAASVCLSITSWAFMPSSSLAGAENLTQEEPWNSYLWKTLWICCWSQ